MSTELLARVREEPTREFAGKIIEKGGEVEGVEGLDKLVHVFPRCCG